MRALRIILLVIAALTYVGGAASPVPAIDDKAVPKPAIPKPPKAPRVTVVESTSESTHTVIVGSGTGSTVGMIGDSIYARKITIDPSGIHIVDREGRDIILPEHPLGHVDVPDLPHVNHGGGVGIIIEDDGNVRVVAPEGDDNVTQIADDIEVSEDEIVRGDVVCIFCDIDVKGTVTGSAVSAFGNVNVEGRVGNEAIAPFGRIRVGPEGHVRSDAVASRIIRDPGGRIDGSRQEVLFNIFGGDDGLNEAWTRQTFTVIVILKILFWLFLVLLAHALSARNIVKVKERIQKSYAKSFLMGVLGQILLIPVFLLLLVTIIGIPVALFVLPLMLFGGLILAQAAVGQLVGDKIAENTSMPLHTPLSRTIFGVAALQIFAYLTIIFIWPAGGGSSGGAFRLVTLIMFALSAILGYVVVTLGTGAVILTRFGTRPKEVPATTDIPSIPPIPAIPGIPDPAVTPLPFEPRRPDESGTAPAPLS